MRLRFFIAALLLLLTPLVHAEVVFNANVLYLSDTFTLATATSSKRTLWDLGISMSLTKKGQLVLGWNYASSSFVDNDGTTTKTLTVSDMGPLLGFFLDKDYEWSVFVAYNLITKGNYNNGSSTIEYRGSSIKADFGYTPKISESCYLGVKMNYYKPNFKEQITGQTALAQVSYGRAVIYPTLSLGMRF